MFQFLQSTHIAGIYGVNNAAPQMVFQNHFARFIYCRAHGGKLDKHICTVAPLFDHASHRSQMANSPGKAVKDRFRTFMVVFVSVFMVVVVVVVVATVVVVVVATVVVVVVATVVVVVVATVVVVSYVQHLFSVSL